MVEVETVSGGFIPVIILIGIILTGCGAKENIEKKKKKDEEEIEKQTS